ncbi:HDOD domain-containing protein [Xanthomonas theicola]|uniref:HDOD domain-containing protein n=1 Tax=Xanthomonas theicola TaxID=56464 RepID=A0A2S6ZCR3_9XANT|nr:HDOD domain-containing protein [Xanthomonas theicola]PPT88435.1 HDOD domain-containing protein [Xanthomonas theicola]QNH25331.1 HDOD domain-containing protein [Xanthomonas theicola]
MSVPSIWIAGLAVLLLGVGSWMLRRGRRGGPVARIDVARHGQAAAVPRAEPDAGRQAAGAAQAEHDAAGQDADLAPGQEVALLARLYALAFAAVSAPAPSAASRAAHAGVGAAAAAVLARIDAYPRYTPRRPHLLPQLTRAINDPGASAQAIVAILGQDPTLAGNLLRVANSTAYRRRAEPIENLERAVALLGTEGLRQIVLAALLQPVIADDGSVFGRCAALLWEHTLLSARATALHAARAERDDPCAAQLLALLYGLGAVAVVQVVRDAYARQPQLVPDAATLAESLQAWSAPVAQAVSRSWALSERMQRALHEQRTDGGLAALSLLGRSLRLGRREAAVALLDADRR